MKHITGETITLPPLKQSSTIAEVKAAFQNVVGIPADHQCLVIDAKKAEDDRTLDFYGRSPFLSYSHIYSLGGKEVPNFWFLISSPEPKAQR